MAKVKFKKIEIVSLIKENKKIIEYLQKKEAVELKSIDNKKLKKLKVDKSLSLIKNRISVSNEAKSILIQKGAKVGNLLSSFEGRKEMTYNDFYNKSKNIKELYGECLYIVSKEKEIKDCQSKIAKDKANLEAVSEWSDLDIQTSYAGTKNTSTFIGYFKKELDENKLFEILKSHKIDTSLCDITILTKTKLQTKVILTCHKELEDSVYKVLNEENFSYPQNPTKHPPIVRINRLKGEISNLEKIICENEKSILGKLSFINEINFVIDYFNLNLKKYEEIKKSSSTKKTSFIEGFIIEDNSKEIKKELEEKYCCFVDLIEIEPQDDAILLKNSKFSNPVEPITEMYALPNKHDIDPTSVMAFFYYLFFGMMLSDAGYGVVMVIATHLLIKKKKPEGTMLKTLKMFFYCGISTIFWGALFGGWFGDIVHVIGRDFFSVEVPSLALWYEPLTNPMSLLLLSFLLGIFHLFLGYIVRFYMLYKENKKKEAIFEVIPTMLLIIGIAPLGTSILVSVPSYLTQIGGYISIVAVILIILTTDNSKNILKRLGGGVYGLYNIASGSLSDILSYSRLLALGLATGSIANVVNLMGSMPSNLAVKGILLFFVFFIGHALNMAINMLGSYVHANRLQFVELFSKFYEGGGKPFKPFTPDTKYIKLVDKN